MIQGDIAMTTDTLSQSRALAPGDGLHLDMLGTLATFKAFTSDTNGAYCLFEGRIMPGEVAPLHYHPIDDETYYFLEGHFTLWLGEQQIDAVAGTYAFVPHGTVHGYRNIGDTPGRLLVMLSPGDKHEQHFLHYGHQIADPSAPLIRPSPQDIARYVAEVPEYGIVLVSSQQST
jgi:mannose-6-phosphate isomerase-like protein (cupin superfamily)